MGVILIHRNNLRNRFTCVTEIQLSWPQYFLWNGKMNFHLKVLCCGYGLLHRDKKQNVVICHSWLKNCWGFCNFFRRPSFVYDLFLYAADANSTNSKSLSNTLLYFPLSSLRKEYKTATLAVKQRGIKKPSWFF